MRTQRGGRTTRGGFTLIEMLVVVAIVAVLMGIVLSGIAAVREGAKRKQAQTEAMSIADAIKRYRMEYGKYPRQTDASADKTLSTNGGDAAILQYTYSALTNTTGTADNPRRITFLTLKDSSVDEKFGYYAIDPWGNGYVVGVDWTGDGKVDMKLPSGVQTQILHETVAVASGGKDFGSSESREVYSWRR